MTGSRSAQPIRRALRVLLRPGPRSDLAHEWRRRLRGRPDLPRGPIRSILCVCHGNVCRSPFAAALLAARLPARVVRSAALFGVDGAACDATARLAAQHFALDLGGHRSRRMLDRDAAEADLILTMQGRQRREVARRWPHARARTRLLGDFLDEPPFLLPDPWGQPEIVFAALFTRIERAVAALCRELERANGDAEPRGAQAVREAAGAERQGLGLGA